jgi:hypothetical protein
MRVSKSLHMPLNWLNETINSIFVFIRQKNIILISAYSNFYY